MEGKKLVFEIGKQVTDKTGDKKAKTTLFKNDA